MKIKKNCRTIALRFFAFGLVLLLVGCSLHQVRKTPISKQYTNIDEVSYDNGFPKQKIPWIVFSDRSNNRINPTQKPDLDLIFKETSFLSPFIVLKEKKGMFKLAEYKPDLINDGKLPKQKKLKIIGWIPKEHLLLWTNSIKNSKTGFSSKASIVINHEDVIKDSKKFIENDSAIVFTSPDLITKAKTKISLGNLVYIYKVSEDKECYLIGRQQSEIPENIDKNIYGWVSKKMITVWGERFSVKVISDSLDVAILPNNESKSFKDHGLTSNEIRNRTGLESIYPLIENDSVVKHKYFTNVFNYDKNKIYNVLGDPIYYQKYRSILTENKKLNIVFVIDASKSNRPYVPVVKSLLQELQLKFIEPKYSNSVKFGAVVFKQNSCWQTELQSPLSSNYRDVTFFLEDRVDLLNCDDTEIGQPVNKGLIEAAKMLKNKQDETNIVVLVGTTTDQSQSAIGALTEVNARLIFFQTQSKTSDSYNDFMLLSERTVVNTAKNIVERKKEKIVNQDDLLIENNYNLTSGENGIYYLDFPNQSMTQGMVIFPKKGETMPASFLKSAIDTLLIQVEKDNAKIDHTLTKYFRSEIGVNNTWLKDIYKSRFPLSDDLIPTSIASSMLNQQTSFLIDGKIISLNDSLKVKFKNGVLLNEFEYEQLKSLYATIHKRVIDPEDSFDKRDGMRVYLKIISDYIPSSNKLSRRKLKRKAMNEIVKLSTGYYSEGDSLMKLTPKQWVKNNELKTKMVSDYFEQFKEIASKLTTSKSDNSIRIEHQGQIFYWLSDEYFPKIRKPKR